MTSDAVFAYDPDKHEGALREALPLMLRAATNALCSHLNPEEWRAAHESGLGYTEMVFAAGAFLRFAYVAPASDLGVA